MISGFLFTSPSAQDMEVSQLREFFSQIALCDDPCKILIKRHSNVYEVKMVCHIKKWLHSLSYLLSYCPLISILQTIFVHIITR